MRLCDKCLLAFKKEIIDFCIYFNSKDRYFLRFYDYVRDIGHRYFIVYSSLACLG